MICPEELKLSKENPDRHEISFLDLDIKTKDEKFHFSMSVKSINIRSSIVYSAIFVESLRIAGASNNK